MAKKLIDMLMKVPAIELKPLFSKLMGVKRAYIVAALVVIAVPAILLTYGFVHMVGTSKVYCLNCHVNQRNMGYWKASTVHPSVSCNSCHDVENKGARARLSISASPRKATSSPATAWDAIRRPGQRRRLRREGQDAPCKRAYPHTPRNAHKGAGDKMHLLPQQHIPRKASGQVRHVQADDGDLLHLP